MTDITFRVMKHTVKPNQDLVEVLWDGIPCAAIYPTEKGIKLVSAHIHGEIKIEDQSVLIPIPAVHINFDPQPYSIVDGKLIKHGAIR